jgi:hypothetical protein
LRTALESIESGNQRYACAAIQDAETDLRFLHNENVTSKAMQVFSRFQPAWVNDNVKLSQTWWPKDSPDRIAALKSAIATTESKGD